MGLVEGNDDLWNMFGSSSLETPASAPDLMRAFVAGDGHGYLGAHGHAPPLDHMLGSLIKREQL